MDDDAMKMGAVLLGGYLLGRTKKARAVASLALWAVGSQYNLRPRDLLRDGAVRLARTPEVARLADEVRGPLLAAGRRAATSALQAQATQLGDTLQRRTDVLTGEVVDDDSEDEESEPQGEDEVARKRSGNAGKSAGARRQSTSAADKGTGRASTSTKRTAKTADSASKPARKSTAKTRSSHGQARKSTTAKTRSSNGQARKSTGQTRTSTRSAQGRATSTRRTR